MRITRRDAATKAAAAVLLVLAFFIARRIVLVCFLALKIVGHPEALDAWEGAVSRRTVEHGGIPIDIYQKPNPRSAILIVHGVNPTGKDSLDLVRISEALAQVGYRVFVPDFVEMKKVHLQPEDSLRIKSTFQLIGQDAGIACFSYGCGPALIAVADPDIREHVRFALAFGGYFDIREALEFVVTGPGAPIAYLKWVYLENNSDVLADEADRVRLRTIAENRRSETAMTDRPAESLSRDAQAVLDIFSASTSADFRSRLNAAPEGVRQRLDALSPSKFFEQIRAPLILVHGVNDPVIPAQQSIEFAEAARARGLKHSLTLLRMYGHVNPILPPVGLISVFGFYLPETARLLGLVNRLTGFAS
jgi:hypothetical protein